MRIKIAKRFLVYLPLFILLEFAAGCNMIPQLSGPQNNNSGSNPNVPLWAANQVGSVSFNMNIQPMLYSSSSGGSSQITISYTSTLWVGDPSVTFPATISLVGSGQISPSSESINIQQGIYNPSTRSLTPLTSTAFTSTVSIPGGISNFNTQGTIVLEYNITNLYTKIIGSVGLSLPEGLSQTTNNMQLYYTATPIVPTSDSIQVYTEYGISYFTININDLGGCFGPNVPQSERYVQLQKLDLILVGSQPLEESYDSDIFKCVGIEPNGEIPIPASITCYIYWEKLPSSYQQVIRTSQLIAQLEMEYTYICSGEVSGTFQIISTS